jgi:hypothetical protein
MYAGRLPNEYSVTERRRAAAADFSRDQMRLREHSRPHHTLRKVFGLPHPRSAQLPLRAGTIRQGLSGRRTHRKRKSAHERSRHAPQPAPSPAFTTPFRASGGGFLTPRTIPSQARPHRCTGKNLWKNESPVQNSPPRLAGAGPEPQKPGQQVVNINTGTPICATFRDGAAKSARVSAPAWRHRSGAQASVQPRLICRLRRRARG